MRTARTWGALAAVLLLTGSARAQGTQPDVLLRQAQELGPLLLLLVFLIALVYFSGRAVMQHLKNKAAEIAARPTTATTEMGRQTNVLVSMAQSVADLATSLGEQMQISREMVDTWKHESEAARREAADIKTAVDAGMSKRLELESGWLGLMEAFGKDQAALRARIEQASQADMLHAQDAEARHKITTERLARIETVLDTIAADTRVGGTIHSAIKAVRDEVNALRDELKRDEKDGTYDQATDPTAVPADDRMPAAADGGSNGAG